MPSKRKGLNKGLDALLGDAFKTANKPAGVKSAENEDSKRSSLATRLQSIDDLQSNQNTTESEDAGKPLPGNPQDYIQQIPLDECQRGRYQPRRIIDDETLEELASSIKSQGVMQPITLRPLAVQAENGARYEIVAGERRWRASRLAGLKTVPAIVRDLSDDAAVAMALIENLQRDDLNPMEEAYALQRLQQEFELTHQQIADTLGKSRTAVSNCLRLMALSKDVKLMLENGDLEMGHARALLSLGEVQQVDAAREVIDKGLTVRQTEALVKQRLHPVESEKQLPAEVDPDIKQLENDLSEKLGVPVALRHQSSGKGVLTLKYNSLDELDGILDHIK